MQPFSHTHLVVAMDLRTVVSDHLIKLVGGSDEMTVDFVVETAKSAKSASSLQDKLSSMLESDDADLKRFSDDLYARVSKPVAYSTSAAPRVKPRSSKKKYALVDMEVEVDTETGKDPIDFLALILAGGGTDMEHVLRDDLAIIRDRATIECS